MILSIILLSLYRTVFSVSIETNTRVVPTTNNVNTTLVSRTFESVTLLRCVRLCLDTGKAPFYYDKANNTCYCYTEWNALSVLEEEADLSMSFVSASNPDKIFGYPTFSGTVSTPCA